MNSNKSRVARPSDFFRPLKGPQKDFVDNATQEIEWEAPRGSGKSTGLILAALAFIDEHEGDGRVLIVGAGPVHLSGAWNVLDGLARALEISGCLIRCSSTAEVQLDWGSISFVDGTDATHGTDLCAPFRSIQGTTFHFVGVDDAEAISPDRLAWLRSRLRAPHFFRVTRNPLDKAG